MKTIIYFEGDTKLRKGFRKFFSKYFDNNAVPNRLISCGSEPVKDFLTGAPTDKERGFFPILLMDSDVFGKEEPRTAVRRTSVWSKRGNDSISDSQLHFMVKLMEAWFLADKEALKKHYGQGFRISRLPQRRRVEEIPAEDVKKGLDGATAKTRKGKYSNNKAVYGSQLLEKINPLKVKEAAPHCAALLKTLEEVTKGQQCQTTSN